MEPERVIIPIAFTAEEARILRLHAEETAESGGSVSWFVRAACALSGVFCGDIAPDLRHLFDDESDA